MLLSKDNTSRVEANNRITWYLKTSLDKTIDLPSDIFMIEFDDLNEKVEEPIGEYTVCDLYLISSLCNCVYISNNFKFFLEKRFG